MKKMIAMILCLLLAQATMITGLAAADANAPVSEFVAQEIKFTKDRDYAVYSGPGTQYLRGANGRAYVSTNGPIWVYGIDSGYALVQYETTQYNYRWGYIDAKALPAKSSVAAMTFSWSPAKITSATSITDDPFGGMRSLKKLPVNTAVMYLAQNSGWAYIEYNNGQDTPVRGFVPMNTLEFTSNI